MPLGAMDQQRQPSPSEAHEGFHYGLHHIARHNANTPYHYMDQGSYVDSGHQTPDYGSPAPGVQEVTPQQMTDSYYTANHYSNPQEPSYTGLGIRYQDDHDAPQYPFYANEPQPFNGVPYNHRELQSASSPTPRSSTNSDGGRPTRRGRSAAPSITSHADRPRKTRSPKPKRPKAGKEKAKTPQLTAPLSVLTKDYTHVPVRDMEKWVNRPLEERHEETVQRNGHVARPMNSFMLYRSAYAERIKVWCLQNNHQVVSSVSGESWPLEPPEVREMFNEYAKIERANHQAAHPDYKFSPGKAGGSSRKRKDIDFGEEIQKDMSDSDDGDGEWGPPSQRKARPKQTKRQARSTNSSKDLSRPSSSPEFRGSSALNRSRNTLNVLDELDVYREYYRRNKYYANSTPDLEVMSLNDANYMWPQNQDGPSMIGLPGGEHRDLLQLQSRAGTPFVRESPVDPTLLAYDTAGHPIPENRRFDSPFSTGDASQSESQQRQATNYPTLTAAAEYHPQQWEVDTTLRPMEVGSQFDQWMEEH